MVQIIEILTRRDYKMKMLISIKICDVFQIICFFVAKRYIMMSSLANCYAKYVFFKIFALMLSSSWLMQRQMSPTEGLVKYSVLEIQEFKLTCHLFPDAKIHRFLKCKKETDMSAFVLFLKCKNKD